MVSMSNWTPERMEALIDDFLGDGDPADPKEKKRRRILKEATELFLKYGYRRASVDEIARHAGVAKGTVYLYFKTKVDLLMHAIALEKKRYFKEIRPIFSKELSPRDRVQKWVEAMLVVGQKMPLVAKMISGDREILAAMADLDMDTSSEWESIRFQFMGEMLKEAAMPDVLTDEECRKRAIVLQALSFASTSITDERLLGGMTVEQFANVFADMMADGIASNKVPDSSKS